MTRWMGTGFGTGIWPWLGDMALIPSYGVRRLWRGWLGHCATHRPYELSSPRVSVHWIGAKWRNVPDVPVGLLPSPWCFPSGGRRVSHVASR